MAKEEEVALSWAASRSWRLTLGERLFGEEGKALPVIVRTELRRLAWPNPPAAVDVSYRVLYVDVRHEITTTHSPISAAWKVQVGFWCHRLKADGQPAMNVNSGMSWFTPADALHSVTMPDEIRDFIRKHQYGSSSLRLVERLHHDD